jgi:eukaryotic-like serine/threonine-protein kinase
MDLQSGARIGPYEVREPLGKGGMGQVYRARDTRLNRDVALKVLPQLFQADPDRLARFTREAQTLAALNHPNIAQIHGLEEDPASGAGQPGIRALAMELVDGEDLSTLIGRGPMALGDALPIARQIADALEAAHELGIIHRDLKPANIKIRPDGTVKVLDFGLAKAMSPEVTSGTDPMYSPTLTAAHATELGVILGTAAYMAPEQARGKPVDRRADVWAFGVVLYEMLTGTRAFEGEDVSVTLASVLKDEPRWEQLPADLPSSVERLLRRCLEKEPKRRLRAIGDARLDLEEQAPLPAAQAPVVRRRSPSWLFGALGGIAAAAVVAIALWPGAGAVPEARLARLSVLPPPGERLYPDSTGVAISPDGTMVAFIVGAVARSDSQLWVRDLRSLQSRRIEGGDGAQLVFWSPDSRRIGFFALGKIKSISPAGGRADIICDAPGGRGAIWTPSNVIVFAPDAGGPLFRVAATGGTPEAITQIDPSRKEYSHRFPALLPDGVHFLYASLPGRNGRFDIFAGSLNDSSRTLVGSLDAAPVYAEPGWLLYARQGLLNAVRFDADALKITGEPVALDDEPAMILDPSTSFTAGRSVSVSSTGAVAYYSSPSANTVATWYDATGVPIGTLNMPPGHYESIAISPDGSRGVMVKSTSPSESSLWLTDMARGGASPLTTGPGRNDSPLWSPDGTQVAFSGDRDGFQSIFVKNVNDAAHEKLLYDSDVPFKNPVSWSPDGRWIVLTQLDPVTSQNVWLLDASGEKGPTILVRGATRDNAGPVSPNGKWLAFFADDSGRFELFVQPFPDPGPRVQVSEKGAVTAWWRRDGRELVFLGDDLRSLWRVDVQGGSRFTVVGTPRRFAMLPADVVFAAAMPDGQRFVAIAPERTGTGSITVVQNWRAALAR